jgi:insulysin
MRKLESTQDRFRIIQKSLLRSMGNQDYKELWKQSTDFVEFLTSEKGFILDDQLKELPLLTLQDIELYYPRLLEELRIEILVHGNFLKEDAIRLPDLTLSILESRQLCPTKWPENRSVILSPGRHIVYQRVLKDPENPNNCIEYILYIGNKANRRLLAMTLLLDMMTFGPAFDELRNKGGLGFTVKCNVWMNANRIGYRFLILSQKTPELLKTRIDTFLTGHGNTIRNMTSLEFGKLSPDWQ